MERIKFATITCLSGVCVSLAVLCTMVLSEYGKLVKTHAAAVSQYEQKISTLTTAIEKKGDVHNEYNEIVFVVKNTGDGVTLADKNRNWLNIKKLSNGAEWEGQIGVDKFGHVIFSDEAYSIRAGAIILKNYERKHGIDTVTKLVKRFCTSNHTAYIQHICRVLKVKSDEKVSLVERMPELLAAMAQFETGKKLRPEHLAMVEVAKL